MDAEFGAGISELWMVSAEPFSTKRVRRVKTLWMRKVTMRALIKRKMARPRRMFAVRRAGRRTDASCQGRRLVGVLTEGKLVEFVEIGHRGCPNNPLSSLSMIRRVKH